MRGGWVARPARLAQMARPPPSERRRAAAAMAMPRPVLTLVGMRAHIWVATVHADAATMATGIVERGRL